MTAPGRVSGGVTEDEMFRLANWASRRGPARDREDMRAEALLRVWEVAVGGQRDGLVSAARDGARAARMSAEWMTTVDRARVAERRGDTPPTRLDDSGWVPDVSGVHDSVADCGLGDVLEGVVSAVADAGGDPERVRIALEVLCDSVGVVWRGNVGGTRSTAFDVPAAKLALASGLTAVQCAALKVLIVGERARSGGGQKRRPCVPGLLARVHGGDHSVWSDPRVKKMIAAVAQAGGLRLVRPWSGPVTAQAKDAPRLSA